MKRLAYFYINDIIKVRTLTDIEVRSLGKPNARLTIAGTHAKTATFTCDKEIDLRVFERVIAEIARYGAYATLMTQAKTAGQPVDTQDCLITTGVIVDEGTWFDIGNELSRKLGITLAM